MGVKLKFNKLAARSLAKELRRASWGVVGVTSFGGLHLDAGLVLVSGAAGWLVLQLSAFVIDSLQGS